MRSGPMEFGLAFLVASLCISGCPLLPPLETEPEPPALEENLVKDSDPDGDFVVVYASKNCQVRVLPDNRGLELWSRYLYQGRLYEREAEVFPNGRGGWRMIDRARRVLDPDSCEPLVYANPRAIDPFWRACREASKNLPDEIRQIIGSVYDGVGR